MFRIDYEKKYTAQKKRADMLQNKVNALISENERLHQEIELYCDVIDAAKKLEAEYRQAVEDMEKMKEEYEAAVRDAKMIASNSKKVFKNFLKKLK